MATLWLWIKVIRFTLLALAAAFAYYPDAIRGFLAPSFRDHHAAHFAQKVIAPTFGIVGVEWFSGFWENFITQSLVAALGGKSDAWVQNVAVNVPPMSTSSLLSNRWLVIQHDELKQIRMRYRSFFGDTQEQQQRQRRHDYEGSEKMRQGAIEAEQYFKHIRKVQPGTIQLLQYKGIYGSSSKSEGRSTSSGSSTSTPTTTSSLAVASTYRNITSGDTVELSVTIKRDDRSRTKVRVHLPVQFEVGKKSVIDALEQAVTMMMFAPTATTPTTPPQTQEFVRIRASWESCFGELGFPAWGVGRREDIILELTLVKAQPPAPPLPPHPSSVASAST